MNYVQKFNVNGKSIDISSEDISFDSLDTSLFDLNIVDESTNVLCMFKNGHIQTKNFYSGDIIKSIDSLNNTINNLNIDSSSSFTFPENIRLQYIRQLNPDFVFNNVGMHGTFCKKKIDGIDTLSTWVSGSEILFKVRNTTSIACNFLVDNGTTTPICYFNIDDGDWKSFEIDSSTKTISSSLTQAKEHIIRIRYWAANTSAKENEYTTRKSIFNFQSVTLDDNGEIFPMTVLNPKILFMGDSITAGDGIRNVYQPYAYKLCNKLNAQIISCALCGTGVAHSSVDDRIPHLQILFDYMFNGEFTYINTPNLVIINIGTNDWGITSDAFITAYESLLSDIKQRFGDVPILAVCPFNGSHKEDMKSFIENYTNTYFISSDDIKGKYTTTDGVHPDVAGAEVLAEFLKKKIIALLGKNLIYNLY